MIVAKDNYAEILEQAGIQARSNSPWLSVGDVRRVQGWKFHISSTPVESCDLLRAILPFLADNLLPFKVAESGACLVRLNDGSYGGSQIGKFMTIYPHDDSNLEDIAAKLIERTVDFTGPVVASDYWLGGVIYVRYGAFNPILRRNRLGEVEKKIFDHLGTERRDSYEAPITKRKRDINHLIGGLEVNSDVTEEDRQGGIFGPGYLLTDVLQMSAKGSVFRAIDVRNPKK